MNINDGKAKHSCTSCQMCAAVCPKNAITISLDKDGFYRPIVDSNLCVNCSICTNICYKYDNQIEDFGKDKLASTILYGASAKDVNIVKRTTSGGIADILAHELMQEGYKCVGVVYDSEYDIAIDIIANSEADLDKFRGSKYIQSYTFNAFKEIVNNCKNEKYAIFGTPCHIFSIDKFLRQRKVRDQHILIDLYCHGCPSMLIWEKYIKKIKEKTFYTKIDNVNFSSKTMGWGNYSMEISTNGKIQYHSNNRHNEFFDLFFSDQILNDACNDCKLRGTLAYTDIRLGDFWGKQYVMNLKGVSAVSLVTDKAKALFATISDKVTYKKERYENFLPWQSWGKKHNPKPELRKILLEQLRDKNTTLDLCIHTIHRQQSLREKLSRHCKNFVHVFPIQFEKYIRWVFYHLR